MASRVASRSLRFVGASAARSTGGVGPRLAARRMMSSDAGHSAKPKSDVPWMTGSTAIFGSILSYLLIPSGDKKAHEHGSEFDKEHEAHVPAQNPSSVKGGNEDIKTEPVLKDDEGTEVPQKEVEESMQKAYDTDSPKDADAAEEGKQSDKTTPYDQGAPGQDSKSETDADASPNRTHRTGSLQSPEEEGPTDMSKARAAASNDQHPAKIAKEGQDPEQQKAEQKGGEQNLKEGEKKGEKKEGEQKEGEKSS